MKTIIRLALAISLCCLGCFASAQTVTVASLNTEWLWTPYDKVAEGSRVTRSDMTPDAYLKEIAFYANLVNKNHIDLVAVSEVENRLVVDDLAKAFGAGWAGYFRQGRDTATGQDVAILTRLAVVPGSVTDFGFPCAKVDGLRKQKCLSKVLGLTLKVQKQQNDYYVNVITSHFLSKRNESKLKRLKRLAQSKALLKAVSAQSRRYSAAMVVLGDLNDHAGSETLISLQDGGALQNSLACHQPKMDNRIDHVLFKNASCLSDKRVSLGKHSDHKATITVLEL